MTTIDALNRTLAAVTPVASGLLTLFAVPQGEDGPLFVEQDDGGLHATLRIIEWSEDDGRRNIDSVKEQEVCFVPGPQRAHPHLIPWIQGWAAALEVAFAALSEQQRAWTGTSWNGPVGRWMPQDFVHPDVLRLKRPRAVRDYTDALLDARHRLGRMVDPR
ncbi:MAG: hypothetical protein H6739_30570 [Alphaproteobacteria bacterium]|nr:hypothetical protein [Alphaproteobacteria bacterium]